MNKELPISRNDLLQMLSEYYSIKERRDLEVKDSLKIRYVKGEKIVDIKFYAEIYIRGVKFDIFLKDKDIREVLYNYAKNMGYILESYGYISNVKERKNSFGDVIPEFEGVMLYMHEKEKVRTR